MRRADRLFQIVLMLGRGRVLTADVIAQRLEVSVRPVYRDVADLAMSGVPIEGEAGVGYVMRSGYQVPPMMFDEEELQALLFGADVARSYGDKAMAAAADRILAKVDAVLPERLRPNLDASKLMVPAFRMPAEVAAKLGEARTAINTHHRLFLDYRNASDDASERIIWPLALAYWGRNWTLGGWCELRQAFRNFRLDRIDEMRTLGSRFPDEPGRGLSDYLADSGPWA
ncbi:MAG: YafY family protein [Proteobacteria bacterium]|nr:YafY family protein [Pseudomonadota bacterium]